MPRWLRVAALTDCPPGSTLEVVAGDRMVALANIEGALFALDGVCPHQGGPLGQGRLTGGILTCPWHGWQFDIRTGESCLSQSVVQPRFAVRVEDKSIWVEVPDEDE